MDMSFHLLPAGEDDDARPRMSPMAPKTVQRIGALGVIGGSVVGGRA